MHATQGHGYLAYVWFRKALVLCIRKKSTLEGDSVRSALPMSDEERRTKVDPIGLMISNAAQANRDHQARNETRFTKKWISQETDRQMRDAFHEFGAELYRAGNVSEAADYTVRFRSIERRISWGEGRYGKWILYWIWGLTCGYGQSLGRWIISSGVIVILYAAAYKIFDLASHATTLVDYLYFSITTITTLGYGDILPQHAAGKLLACSEAVMGLIMFGFLLSLSTRSISKD